MTRFVSCSLAFASLLAACGGPGADQASDAGGDSQHAIADAAVDAARRPLALAPLSTTDKLTLAGVWGASATDVWIVTDNTGGGYGRIMHASDGATFTDVGSAGAFGGLYGVWGSASDDVWAVGGDSFADSGVLVLLHWNGMTWTDDHRATGVSGHYLLGVYGTSASDVWFVGEQTLLHWNGSTFASSGSITTHLDAVWGSAPDAYTFVGANGWVQPSGGNGTELGTGATLRAITGTGAGDMWAVGDRGLALHFDGTHWTQVATGTTQDLFGVWANAANDVIAVGTLGTVLRWNGSAWEVVAVPSAFANQSFVAVGGLHDEVAWIVGTNGTALAASLTP